MLADTCRTTMVTSGTVLHAMPNLKDENRDNIRRKASWQVQELCPSA